MQGCTYETFIRKSIVIKKILICIKLKKKSQVNHTYLFKIKHTQYYLKITTI
jgi:hypothetical protein